MPKPDERDHPHHPLNARARLGKMAADMRMCAQSDSISAYVDGMPAPMRDHLIQNSCLLRNWANQLDHILETGNLP